MATRREFLLSPTVALATALPVGSASAKELEIKCCKCGIGKVKGAGLIGPHGDGSIICGRCFEELSPIPQIWAVMAKAHPTWERGTLYRLTVSVYGSREIHEHIDYHYHSIYDCGGVQLVSGSESVFRPKFLGRYGAFMHVCKFMKLWLDPARAEWPIVPLLLGD